MAEEQPEFVIEYTSRALADLREIWHWNSTMYSVQHADEYAEWLSFKIDELRFGPSITVPNQVESNYRVLLMVKHQKTDGHLAIVRFDNDQIATIVRVFHTKQDWQNAIKS